MLTFPSVRASWTTESCFEISHDCVKKNIFCGNLTNDWYWTTETGFNLFLQMRRTDNAHFPHLQANSPQNSSPKSL